MTKWKYFFFDQCFEYKIIDLNHYIARIVIFTTGRFCYKPDNFFGLIKDIKKNTYLLKNNKNIIYLIVLLNMILNRILQT